MKLLVFLSFIFLNCCICKGQDVNKLMHEYSTAKNTTDKTDLFYKYSSSSSLGDNRDASFGDSRFSGAVTINNIAGKGTDIISSKDGRRIGKPFESSACFKKLISPGITKYVTSQTCLTKSSYFGIANICGSTSLFISALV